MNTPEIYLIEPYNAYAPKRKKHWMEEVEEQALLAKIIAEQQAQQKAIAEAKNASLPPNAPPVSAQTLAQSMADSSNNSSGNTAVGGAAGGGGTPVWDFFSNADAVNFDRSPATGAGPLTVTFTNLTTTPQFDTYNWYFTIDGVTTTSTDVNPVVLFQTGSSNPTVITASLQVTNSVSGNPSGKSPDVYTLVSYPTVTSAFTVTTSSNVAPYSMSFTNGSSTDSQTPPTLAYLWTFTYNDGVSAPVVTTSTLATPAARRVDSGSFTASLKTTGAYNITSSVTHSYAAAAPTFGVTFTVTTSSNIAPATATLTPTITYNGIGSYTGSWRSGEWAEGGGEYTLPYAGAWTNRSYDTRSGVAATNGEFTASLALRENVYGIMAFYTQSFKLDLPTLIVNFITTSFGFGGVENSYMEPVTMSYTSANYWNGNQPLTVLWDFGSASFWSDGSGATNGTTSSIGPHTVADYGPGSFTASLQMTGSYGISGIATQSFVVST